MSIQPGNPPEPLVQPETATVEPRQPFSWRLFWLLALMMMLASLMLLPYALQLMAVGKPDIAGSAATRGSAVFSSLLQTVILYWPAALLGLLVAGKIGLGAPFLHALVENRPAPGRFSRVLAVSTLVGFGAGIAVLALIGVLSPFISGELAQLTVKTSSASLPNAWQGFLGSASAGINEEILLRLFLLSLIAWVIQRVILRRPAGLPSRGLLWTANILAALIFGLLHLPNLTAIGVPVTPFLVLYIITLNGLAGLVFGWLFWTFGLESAMLAHFFTDIVLHVLTVPFQHLGR
jgi:membrane protease YdiL (CAAX protease family)